MYRLDTNERHALLSALENYLNGNGMEDGDEDEQTLELLIDKINGGTVTISD
jgi:hypothetical protein